MKTRFVATLLVGALVPWAYAADPDTPLAPKAQFAADNRSAALRYTNDKSLCRDEANSGARLQCRRDAKAEYDKASAEARARLASTSPGGAAAVTAPAKAAPLCQDCGRVLSVAVTEKAGEGSPLGMIAGGLGGALLGNQVGGGTGKDLATIAGALGGAYAGKMIEEKVRTQTVWTVSAHFGDGSQRNYEFSQDPGYKVGDAVKKTGDTLTR
ncbi:MAG: glycine zipper 2TM domain-containing protein [Rhodoferax sp.]|nr:glycine zipper 2TM domain-containing protein [Rhodoferax sp.]